jgi:hypothetical protein
MLVIKQKYSEALIILKKLYNYIDNKDSSTENKKDKK